MRPVAAGIWTHRDLVADTFTFADLCDAHELLDVKAHNERAVHAFYAQKGKA